MLFNPQLDARVIILENEVMNLLHCGPGVIDKKKGVTKVVNTISQTDSRYTANTQNHSLGAQT